MHSLKAFSFSHSTPQQVDWRWTRGWEGTQEGQLNTPDQRNIPYYMMPAIKAQEKEKECGMFTVMSSQVTTTHTGAQLPSQWLTSA